LQDQLHSDLPNLPGVTTSVEDIQFMNTGGQKPLQLGLQGDDLAALNKTVKEIKARVEKLPGFAE
jgi:Cu/Ag efflux pump CusA